MKIGKGHQTYIQNLKVNKKELQCKNQEDIKQPQDKIVDVEISDSARKLAETVKENGNSEFSKRVEDIRKAVLNNTYKVSSEEIADKIIEKIGKQEGIKYE